MKKTILCLILVPSLVGASEFYSIITGAEKSYLYNDYSETITYSEWLDVGLETDCVTDKIESDIYYGKIFNQTKSCKQEQTRTKTVTKTYVNGTIEEEDTIENQIADVDYNTAITGTHLESDCKHILSNKYSEGSGEYYINHNLNKIPVYCEMERDGGGWTLIRRISGSWNSFSDNLFGTQAVGVYQSDPLHASTFGIIFNNFNYNDLLLTTGDKQKWLITDKTSVQDGWVAEPSCSVASTVYKSSSNPNGPAQTVGWCKRTPNTEDPWISIESHGYEGRSSTNDDMTHSMLYGEYYAGWDYYVGNLNGVSIYIR